MIGVNRATRRRSGLRLVLPLAALCCVSPIRAEPGEPRVYTDEEEQDIARELTNPVANLISVPFNNSFGFGGGPNNDAFRYSLVAQPVIPINLNPDWNLITRTIIPFTDFHSVFPNRETGLGDIVQQFFLSPTRPTSSGIIWGAGPIFSYPTATNNFFGADQWGAGPTAVVVRMTGDWTNFRLVTHLWGIDAPAGAPPLNLTFIQPAIVYTFPTYTSVFVSSETSYNWSTHRWIVPLQLGGNQLSAVNGQLLQLGGLIRYDAVKPAGGSSCVSRSSFRNDWC